MSLPLPGRAGVVATRSRLAATPRTPCRAGGLRLPRSSDKPLESRHAAHHGHNRRHHDHRSNRTAAAGSTSPTSASSMPARWPRSTAGGCAAKRAEATSPAPARSPPAGSRASATPSSRPSPTSTDSTDAAAIVVYGYDDIDARALVDRLTAIGITGLRDARRRLGAAGPRTSSAPVEALPGYRQLVHPSWLPGRPGRRPAGSAADRTVPPVPRQLRRPRGVRGEPPAGRGLPGHQLARGPGGLEPPAAGRARTGPGRARDHATTRRSSSTAATRRAMRTRSGRVAGPARSRRRARR